METHPTWRPSARFASAHVAAAAALAMLALQKRAIVHVHLAENGAFIREGALVLLARRLGKVTIITIHGADFLPFARRYGWIASRVLRRAHLVTCLDLEVLQLVRKMAPRTRAELMPNPVAMDGDSHGAGETEEIVLFAGEIGMRKGADVLCRAWRIVSRCRPRARCIMVGPVDDFAVPTLERLEVRGPVNAGEMKDLLRSARVVALPSRSEGMPMILTEAMSSGRPFVSTPVGGIPDLASEGGVLVEVEDEVGLANHLIAFLADRALAQDVGTRGQEFCRATRSVEVIDTRLGHLYMQASQGNG